MSSFDIVGTILDVAPLVLGGLPKLASVIETLHSAHRIRTESAETICRLTDELKFAFMLLEELDTQCHGIKWKDHRVAREFTSLFESFPGTAERFVTQCRIFTSKPTLLLDFTSRKPDETVAELELHMQRLFRRTTLLLSYLQQSTRTSLASLEAQLCVAHSAHRPSPYPSQIKDFLKPQLDRDSPPRVWYRDMQLHHLTRVGDFDIEYIRDTNRLAIVEKRTLYGDAAIESGLHAAREVVQKLSLDSPADWSGILTCNTADWVSNDADRRKRCAEFTVVYNFPSLAHPTELPETLRSLLRHADDPEHTYRPDLPLPARLSLARDIANAVLFVHVSGLVHKNIRPETILAFPPKEQPHSTEGVAWKAFLAGFIESRGIAQGCNNPWAPILPDDARYTGWDRYLYQHPSCAGPREHQVEFTMLHDIYALGVVLLEVGLWQSLIGSVVSVYTRTQGQWKEEERIRRPLLIFNNKLPDSAEPSQTQALLIVAARDLLPFAMGTLYTDVVISCLECLEVQHEASVQGARFIEQVLDRLDLINM